MISGSHEGLTDQGPHILTRCVTPKNRLISRDERYAIYE